MSQTDCLHGLFPPKQPKIKRHFTRKHYEALQRVFRAFIIASPVDGLETVTDLARAICDMLHAEYPDFDEDRFMRLCGLID